MPSGKICKSLIIQKEYIVQCLSIGVSFSILFQCRNPFNLTEFLGPLDFRGSDSSKSSRSSSLQPTKVVHGEGGRSTGRCNDGFIGFREDDVSEAWFVEPPILQNHCNLMTASWEWKKLIAGYLFHPSRLKWLNKNPGEMADTIVSIGKCAYSYCIFVTFPFSEETLRQMMESWLRKLPKRLILEEGLHSG